MSLLSTENVMREISYYSDNSYDMEDFLWRTSSLLECNLLLEDTEETNIEYNKIVERLKLDVLDVELFVRRNQVQRVSNPRAFSQSNIPSSDGLLSNEIFGFGQEERMGIFGYIDLNGWFIDPSCYKTWIRLDSRIRNIVHGIKYYKISETGDFIEDENGETGIDFLYKNIKKIKFKDSTSLKKNLSIRFLEQNRDRMFIHKYIVIPPFYRDKNTASSSRKTVGLGGINKIYNDLIVATNALTATQDFYFDATNSMKARVQELILNIYDWFCGNSNSAISKDPGIGLSGKMGVLRRTNMSKTANFSTRLVISAAELKSNRPEQLMVTYDKSAVPLYAVMTEFRDFVMYNARLFFENEFRGAQTYPIIDKDGNQKVIVPESPEITFSDERIKHEMERFLHGYNNRFVPIEIPVEGTDEKYYMRFKGRGIGVGEEDKNNPLSRRLTWCDVFYIAAVEASKDKQILITRFPINKSVALASNN